MVVKAEMKAVATTKKNSHFNLVKIKTFRFNSGCRKQQQPVSGAEEQTEDALHFSPGELLPSTQREYLSKLEPIRVELAWYKNNSFHQLLGTRQGKVTVWSQSSHCITKVP